MATFSQVELDYLLNLRADSYFAAAPIALYAWEWLITFSMEVDLVWKSKWTHMKCLYLVQRYMPLIDVGFFMPYQSLGKGMTISRCREVYPGIAWSMLCGILVSELLLALRVRAVWGGGKWPTIVLVLSFIAIWFPGFYEMQVFLESIRYQPPLYPGFVGCPGISGNSLILVGFVCIMIWDIGTLVFMLIPGFKAWHRTGGNMGLFDVVYRQGTIFYLYLVVLSCLNVVAIRTFPLGTNYIFLSPQRCLHTILASRVLLHIRQYVQDENKILSEGPERTGIKFHHQVSDPASPV